MSIVGNYSLGDRLLYLENGLTIADGIKFLAAAIAEKDLLSKAAIKHIGHSFFPELGQSNT